MYVLEAAAAGPLQSAGGEDPNNPSFDHRSSLRNDMKFDPYISSTMKAILEKLAQVLNPCNSSDFRYGVACGKFHHFFKKGSRETALDNVDDLVLCKRQLELMASEAPLPPQSTKIDQSLRTLTDDTNVVRAERFPSKLSPISEVPPMNSPQYRASSVMAVQGHNLSNDAGLIGAENNDYSSKAESPAKRTGAARFLTQLRRLRPAAETDKMDNKRRLVIQKIGEDRLPGIVRDTPTSALHMAMEELPRHLLTIPRPMTPTHAFSTPLFLLKHLYLSWKTFP
ncbi:hypothetical protein BJ165DRAFT_1068734 [Panaeolus papilionaceus]|nr:hypothetical protein BJ165DRAFT_1068734 [Panaeolus papilionaceus]